MILKRSWKNGERMTEKDLFDRTITYKELSKLIDEVLSGYMNMLSAGQMSFSELAILENVLLKLDRGLKEKMEEDD